MDVTGEQAFDVIVVGSGAGALVSAIRAKDLGLDVLIIEKAHLYGGTSALSGGVVWFPCNPDVDGDSPHEALTYLRGITAGEARDERLEAYVASAPEALAYLEKQGVEFESVAGWPDYFSDLPGAKEGRSMVAKTFDAAEVGDSIFTLRDQTFGFRLLDRYALDLAEANALATRPPGWMWTVVKVVSRYWLDLSWRGKTARDRRLTMGAALIGRLRRAVDRKGIPLWLNTSLKSLDYDGNRVVGVVAQQHGRAFNLRARQGVILACGGFEHSQELRANNWPVPTDTAWSHTPKNANTGDGFRAATAIGADTEFLEYGWWAQSTQLPSRKEPNQLNTHQMFFDKHHPNSIAVNQKGQRFVNECCSYDRFGQAMVADYQNTGGANVPCWLIFDATYRQHYTAGGIMPATVMPDRKIPPNWWDNFIYRADTVAGLAAKLRMDPATLEREVAKMNGFAKAGKDDDFGRGGTQYEIFNAGDKRVKPNPCLGPIDTAPYYAVRIDLGDVGSKGGIKASGDARALDTEGKPIPGLYVIGNAAGSPFAKDYPGGGARSALRPSSATARRTISGAPINKDGWAGRSDSR